MAFCLTSFSTQPPPSVPVWPPAGSTTMTRPGLLGRRAPGLHDLAEDLLATLFQGFDQVFVRTSRMVSSRGSVQQGSGRHVQAIASGESWQCNSSRRPVEGSNHDARESSRWATTRCPSREHPARRESVPGGSDRRPAA